MRASLVTRAALALAALSLTAAAAGAQEERIVVRAEPGTPVVAVEVLVAAGPADEGEGMEGIAYLTARAVTAPVRSVMESLGAHLEVHAHHDALSFTVIAAPDVWEEATRRLTASLFRDPADSASTARERAALRAELEARESSPSDVLGMEMDRAVYGEGHPWGRPSVGTAESVQQFGVADVDVFLRRHFTPDRATVAVVGPVDETEARQFLRTALNAAAYYTDGPPAGERANAAVRREYNSITAWVAASYPFGRDADLEALRMIAAMARDRVGFSVARREVYDTRAEVVRHARGGELRLHVVVPPGEVERWADRLQAPVASFAEAPLPPGPFAERLRRFRGERLAELDTPEARARELARELMLTGRRGTELLRLDGLSAARLHEAARALPPAVMVLLGPGLGATEEAAEEETPADEAPAEEPQEEPTAPPPGAR